MPDGPPWRPATAACDGLRVVEDLLLAAMHGEDWPLALCRRLAAELHASVAFYARVDTVEHVCRSVAWPERVVISVLELGLALLSRTQPVALAGLFETGSPSCLSETVDRPGVVTVGGLVLWEATRYRDLAQVPLGATEREVTLVGLARGRDFAAGEMRLLRLLHGPLVALHLLLESVQSAPWLGGDGVPEGRIDGAGNLTPREIEVLRMLAAGLLARTIATRLGVSTRTVHKHLGSIYRKLDAHDRLLAVTRAQMLGVIPGPRPVAERS